MKITTPLKNLISIHKAVMDIIRFLQSSILFEIKEVDLNAVASEEMSYTITASTLSRLYGVVQIASTCEDHPSVAMDNTASAKLTYDFGSGTDGKQTVTLLLVGK